MRYSTFGSTVFARFRRTQEAQEQSGQGFVLIFP
jgi:hypothetical protein